MNALARRLQRAARLTGAILLRRRCAIARRPFRRLPPELRWTPARWDAAIAALDRIGPGQAIAPETLRPDRWPAAPPWELADDRADSPETRAALAFLARCEPDRWPHALGPLDAHLLDTGRILACWGQPAAIVRCGWFHNAYGSDTFPVQWLDPARREELAAAIGPAAEALVFLDGTLDRRSLRGELNRRGEIPADGLPVRHWATGETQHLPPRAIAAWLVVDLASQAQQACGWRRRPGLWLASFARLARCLPGWLDPVPPVFDRCTADLGEIWERSARRLYLQATRAGALAFAPSTAGDSPPETLRDLRDAPTGDGANWTGSGGTAAAEEGADADEVSLGAAVCLNPWIAEPWLLLAERARRSGQAELAADRAAEALTRLTQWGTCWDKRWDWAEAVARARSLGALQPPPSPLGDHEAADDSSVAGSARGNTP